MSDRMPSQEFEEKVRAAASAPGPDAAFVSGLRSKLSAGASQRRSQKRFFPRPAWQWAFGVLVVLLIAFMAIGPQRVLAAVRGLFGYIPGVGLVSQEMPLRILAEPVKVERDGITLTVTQAVLSADKTVIHVYVAGVPRNAFPTDESIGCMGDAALRLPDGTILEGGYIGAGGWTHFENQLVYGPISANVNEAVLAIDCIGFTRPGALPENWEIPLQFVPAPLDMTVAPVIELSTPAATNPPAADVTSTPVLSNTMTRNGITFTLEKFVEVEDGYRLYGNLNLSGAILPVEGYFNTMAMIEMTDANGNRIPFEEARSEPQYNTVYDPNRFAWIYRTNQKAFAAPLILTLSWIEMQITPQVPFEIDLGANPQIGKTWEINRDMIFEGHTVRLLSAQLVKSDDPQWASALKFTYEDKEGGIFINVMDDVPQKPLIEVMGGGGGGGGPLAGIKVAWMNYGEIPADLRRFTISAGVPYRINGPWQVIWNPPPTAEPIPTSAPEACLTSEKWTQVKGQQEALPVGLGGKIVFTTDDMHPDTNVFITNLDGSDTRGLVSAYYPALSPDGTQMALMSLEGGLNILDLNNGQTIFLGNGTNPVWSPDGLRIMFNNPPDGLYSVNADGTGLHKIETGSMRVNPIGWLADKQTIVYGAQVGDIYNLYEHVFKTHNLQTGETKALFPITIKTPGGAISPDGQWIAFKARLFGANLDGAVFISRLDGSERKLVAMLDNTLAFHPVWSPDGQWLIVSVVEPYKPTRPVLVNPFTCQVIPLPAYGGEVYSWRP
jgi:hypothetical protein